MTEIIVSVHQPNFLPWLKLLDKILASDVYIAYDTAQYTRSEYHARQKVKTLTGPVWLSLPLRHVRDTRQAIKDMHLENNQPFRYRHRKVLRNAYRSTPYFDDVYGIMEKVYERDHERMVDLNLDLIEAYCAYLDAPVRIVRASALPHEGGRTERVVQLVRAVGGTTHLTSTYGGDHQDLDWSRFADAGLGVLSQRFQHPRYAQVGRDFIPHLAAVDMLFSRGPATRELLADQRQLARVEAATHEQHEQRERTR